MTWLLVMISAVAAVLLLPPVRRALLTRSIFAVYKKLLPAMECGGWSEQLPDNPPDERQNSPILPWSGVDELRGRLVSLGLVPLT